MENMGMDISGIWVNKLNGSKILVRDAIVDGDNMIVMLTDGRTIDMQQFSDNYLQMSEEEYDTNGRKIESNRQLPVPSVQDQLYKIENEQEPVKFSLDDPIPSKAVNPANSAYSTVNDSAISSLSVNMPPENTKPVNINNEIIAKMLGKCNPSFKLILTWETEPVNEIKILREYFNVTTDDIIDYLVSSDREINYDSIRSSIEGLIE